MAVDRAQMVKPSGWLTVIDSSGIGLDAPLVLLCVGAHSQGGQYGTFSAVCAAPSDKVIKEYQPTD